MPNGTKIATCCYCGTRAALVLTGREGHELACSACGAPLHDLKGLKSAEPKGKAAKPPKPAKVKLKKHKKKKKKSTASKLFGEAFDLFDDIFD